MADDLEPGERHLLGAGLAFVGAFAVMGMVVGALLGGSGLGGLLIGAGAGIVLSVAVFTGFALSRI